MYHNLLAEMEKSRKSFKNIANTIKIKQSILKEKLEGKKDFKINEMLGLLAVLGNFSCDYLFCNKED